MSKKIALLGTAPSSIRLAPYGDETWEIWGCSPGTTGMPRLDKFFELHRWEPDKEWFSEGYMNFLRNFKGQVVMGSQEAVKQSKVPNGVAIDVHHLTNKYGPYFFTSSLAWMAAEAIEEKPDKIAFYGVDMAATTEYKDQRLGCQFFAMMAASQGIEVGVPPESDLLRPAPLYGICEHSHVWIKETVRAREIASRLREAKQLKAAKETEIAFLEGVLDDQDWRLQSFTGNFDTNHCYTVQPIVPEIMLQVPATPSDTPEEKGE